MKKNEILRGDKQFQRLIREGKTVREGSILCHHLIELLKENQPRAVLRAGFSVPRRGMNKAVDRNRIKRLMREAYRNNKKMLAEHIENNRCNLDLLFVYRGTSTTRPRHVKLDNVQKDVVRCLEQVKDRIGGMNRS